MADSMLYDEDMYVLLSPDADETFLTPDQLLHKLKEVLTTYSDHLPRDLQKFASREEQAQYLIRSSCEFETSPGERLQWYAVRLEK